jgi:hypothetical protein
VYDLASAVMYAGGPGQATALTGAYLQTGALGAAEVRRGLAPAAVPVGRPGQLLRLADRHEQPDRDRRS